MGSSLVAARMESTLWYVLSGSRGGSNRARILQTVDERPQNANRIADELDLAYETVRHHLDVLTENDLVRSDGQEYGSSYAPSPASERNWGTVETILETVE